MVLHRDEGREVVLERVRCVYAASRSGVEAAGETLDTYFASAGLNVRDGDHESKRALKRSEGTGTYIGRNGRSSSRCTEHSQL